MFRLAGVLCVVISLVYLPKGLTQECDDLSIGKTLQDPEDCHGYLLCHSGHKVQQYCPGDMKYDDELGVCVVGKCPPCNCLKEPTQSTSTPGISSTTDPASSSTDLPLSSTEPTPSTTSLSPEDDSTESPPTDPTSPTTETAPSTTSSSPPTPSPSTETAPSTTSLSPEDDSTESPPTDPTSPSTEPAPSSSTETDSTLTPLTSSPTNPTSTALPDPSTSCKNLPDGSFFSDPIHCRNYWVCRNGVPVLLYCEIGMWFDDVNFVCNFPHLVDCPANID